MQTIINWLDARKTAWEELAKTDPTEARRQIRVFWGSVGCIAGLVAVWLLGKIM